VDWWIGALVDSRSWRASSSRTSRLHDSIIARIHPAATEERAVRDLSAVRQGWEEVERAEGRLRCSLTAQESFRRWLELQRVFAPQLRDTAALFAPERWSAMAELQSRLSRLVEWQERHGEPGSVDPEAPAAPAGR
jgi:hypothetical protein